MILIQIGNDRKGRIKIFRVRMEQNKYPNAHDYLEQFKHNFLIF